jgi:putative Mn2+ efflux pump MntP
MLLIEIILISLALSIDAFAVAMASSSTGQVRNLRAAIRISFHFGFFQFLFPVIGRFASERLELLIEAYDH